MKPPREEKVVMLLADGDHSRLGVVAAGEPMLRDIEADVDELAATLGGKRPRLVIALPSARWLCGGISVDGLPRRDRREAMLYRLEEKLPVAAEDLAADFIETDGGASLGVATDAAAVRRVGDALAAVGARVAAVAPLPLLALQARPAAAKFDFVVWQHGDEAEVIAVRDGRPTSWATLAADDPADLRLHLRLARPDGDATPEIELRDAKEDLRRALLGDNFAVAAVTTLGLNRCAVAGAAKVLAGERPLVDVAAALPSASAGDSTSAARTSLLVAACALLLVTTFGLLWRANRYDAATAAREAALRDAFAAAFPSERVPLTANIPRRLEIEAKRVGGGDAPAAAAQQRSALELAGRALSLLPRDVRFRLSALDATPSAITLNGEVRALPDMDRLAAALREIEGFTVAAPATPQIGEDRIEFVINAAADEDRRRGEVRP